MDVKNQQHYTAFKIQPIDFITENELGYHQGNIIKYVCRYKHKGEPVKDLYKALDYLERLIAIEENRKPS